MRGRVRRRDESECPECPVCMESTATVSMCWPYACTHAICTGCNRATYVRSDDRCPICRAGRTECPSTSIGQSAIEEREQRLRVSAESSRFGVVFLPIEPPLAARAVVNSNDFVPLEGLNSGAGAGAGAQANWQGDSNGEESSERFALDDVTILSFANSANVSSEREGGVAREPRTSFGRRLTMTLHRDPAVRDALLRLVRFGTRVEQQPR